MGKSRRLVWIAVAGVACAVAVILLLLTRRHPAVAAPLSPAVQRAQAAAGALRSAYYDPANGLLANDPPPQGERYGTTANGSLFGMASFTPTAMWGYSWALAGLEDVAQLPGGSRYLPLVRTLADHLGAYWDAGAPVPGYAPTPNPGPRANKYFDDNAWAGLDLVAAYHLTGDRGYLTQAEAVFTYEESGWDQAGGGGLWWDDAHQTRNTAANAPVAELAAYLYLDTHQATYLTWAQKIYAWELGHLVNPITGEVWDSFNGASVGRQLWTYNQGDVIGAATLLYEITHDPAYLAQAKKTASFALTLVQTGNVLVPQAQFNGVLVDNLQLLYQVTRDPRIAAVITASAQSAWAKARNSDGLVAPNWLGPPVPDADIQILTQSGAVRLLAVAAALAAGGFGAFQL